MTKGDEFPVLPAHFRERKTLTFLRDERAPRTLAQIVADEARVQAVAAERKAAEDAMCAVETAQEEDFQKKKQ